MPNSTKNTKITPESESSVAVAPSEPKVPSPEASQHAESSGKPVKKQGNVDLVALVAKLQQQLFTLESKVAQSENVLKSGITQSDEEAHLSKAERMKQHLAKQPKVRTIIPLEGKEKKGESFLTVILNGYRLNVPKGVYIDLPEQIADIVKQHYEQTDEALHNKFELTGDRADLSQFEDKP